MNRLNVLITMDRHEGLQLKRAGTIPDHPTTHTLGQTYLKLGDFKEARDSFLESIEISPFNPDVHQGLATAYEMLGDQGSALKD
jgi:Tfp pilus assembly protein PilF